MKRPPWPEVGAETVAGGSSRSEWRSRQCPLTQDLVGRPWQGVWILFQFNGKTFQEFKKPLFFKQK